MIPEQVSCDGGTLTTPAGSHDLAAVKNLVVVSFGKAAHVMARSFLETITPALPRHLVPSGIVVGPEQERAPESFESFVGGHPLPNSDSFVAADAVLARLAQLTVDDLIVFLISGGGSTILEKPILEGATLEDWQSLNRTLVGCGAGVVDINVVRKHLSAVKGGRLALAAAPAQQLTLYVSDVPDHLPSAVASGPTLADESTVEDCYSVVQRWGILEELPTIVRDAIQSRALNETPKPGAGAFEGGRWHRLLAGKDGLSVPHGVVELRGTSSPL